MRGERRKHGWRRAFTEQAAARFGVRDPQTQIKPAPALRERACGLCVIHRQSLGHEAEVSERFGCLSGTREPRPRGMEGREGRIVTTRAGFGDDAPAAVLRSAKAGGFDALRGWKLLQPQVDDLSRLHTQRELMDVHWRKGAIRPLESRGPGTRRTA